MNAVAVLLCFGILTLWIPGRWAVAAYQCGTFSLAAAWAASYVLRPFPLRCRHELALLGSVVLYGCFQLAVGLSVYAWQTLKAHSQLGRQRYALLLRPAILGRPRAAATIPQVFARFCFCC